ncbi:VOC family protein [Hymenobacter sp. HD11105]
MIQFTRFDHFLLDIPPGTTAAARTFYGHVLGLPEIAGQHPGGAIWFWAGQVQVHLREEEAATTPSPSSRRHPAFEVANLAEVQAYLTQLGVPVEPATAISGRQRFFFRDPFGNRVELLQFA